MNKSRITIVSLAIALVASNVWWAFQVFDAGVTHTYMRASHESTSELLTQTLALLPVVVKPGATRSEVLSAAIVPGDSTPPFEKEGFVWVGGLGLQFNEQGQFVRAVAGSSAP